MRKKIYRDRQGPDGDKSESRTQFFPIFSEGNVWVPVQYNRPGDQRS